MVINSQSVFDGYETDSDKSEEHYETLLKAAKKLEEYENE